MIFKFKRENPRDKVIAYKKTFTSPEGKMVLLDLMNRNYILNSHKGDAHAEGRRAAILDILHFCNINLTEFDNILGQQGD